MKKAGVFSLMLAVMLLVGPLLAMPAAPARADRGITLSPEEGAIGTRVTITGTEFNKSTADYDKYAAIYISRQEATMLDDIGTDVTIYEMIDDAVWLDYDGDFETAVFIPAKLNDGVVDKDVTGGTYYIYVCHYSGTTLQTRIRAIAEFTVTMGEISLSPLKGTVDSLLEISGIDFIDREDISIKYDGATVPIYSGSRQTSRAGNFASMIRVPDSTAGDHTITAGVAGDEVSATFTVYPEILVSPSSGETGTTAMVIGTGFSKLRVVTLWFHNIRVASAAADALGTFQTSFSVPDTQAGLYYVDAEEGDNLAKAKFTVTAPTPTPSPEPPAPGTVPAISLSDTTGSIGQGLVMSGAGFKPGATVTITYDTLPLTAATADSHGGFATAFDVPPGKHGNHTVAASDGTSTSELVFSVEATPPAPPALVQPGEGTKVKTPVFFAWLDVDDPSRPVTYDFQLATGGGFVGTSIILEKTGLTKPEFPLTETERQGLDIGQDDYYWRVRATDGAANQGEWSNPREFHLVTTAIPVWAIVVLSLIGALLLMFLGYLLHMKTGLFK